MHKKEPGKIISASEIFERNKNANLEGLLFEGVLDQTEEVLKSIGANFFFYEKGPFSNLEELSWRFLAGEWVGPAFIHPWLELFKENQNGKFYHFPEYESDFFEVGFLTEDGKGVPGFFRLKEVRAETIIPALEELQRIAKGFYGVKLLEAEEESDQPEVNVQAIAGAIFLYTVKMLLAIIPLWDIKELIRVADEIKQAETTKPVEKAGKGR